MHLELSPASFVLIAFIAALLLHDLVRLERNRRLLLVQVLVFVGGGFLVLYPDISQRMAHAVGIGRGVDFVLYPLVIWLVRESLLSRRRRHDDQARLTEVVRALAAADAREVHGSGRASPQSTGSSAS